MQSVASATHVYFKSEKFQSELPGNDEWMGLDLSQYVQSEGSLPPNSDPSSQLDLLKGVSDKFEAVGRETIRGVKTTRYRGTFETGLGFEVWIDAKGLLRRMTMKASPSDSTSLEMTVDFYDFGISPDIELPDPEKVFDATNLATPEGSG